MTTLDDDYVRKLAYLARIQLSDDEVAKFKPQLSAILGYVDKLNSVDTSQLAPTSQVTGLAQVARSDKDTRDSTPRDELLDQVPLKQDGQIKVPKVI